MGIGRWTVAAWAAAGLLISGCSGNSALTPQGSGTTGGAGTTGGTTGSHGTTTGGSSSTGTSASSSSTGASSSGSSSSGSGSGSSSGGSSGSSGTTGPAAHVGVTVTTAPSGGWQLLHNGPTSAYDVSADAAGNIWVAAGEQGLYLLQKGSSSWRHFGMGDGLQPYAPPASAAGAHLKALSVAGGEAGNAYVGYEGADGCEDDFDANYDISTGTDHTNPDIYKSGDADHVWLQGGGIGVAHYDIHTPPGVVDEAGTTAWTRGREKLCTIYRIAFDGAHSNLWFGANHGYAWGNPNWPNAASNGQVISGMEHAHPAISGYTTDQNWQTDPEHKDWLLTGEYYGLAVEPGGALWVGGIYRTYRCDLNKSVTDRQGRTLTGFWACEYDDNALYKHQIDIWGKNAAPFADEWQADAPPMFRTDDYVSGLAVMGDGSVWASARNPWYTPQSGQDVGIGLAHLRPDGTVSEYVDQNLPSKRLTGVAPDPNDGGLWVASEDGIFKLDPATHTMYRFSDASAGAVANVQVDRSSTPARILVAFRNGTIGIYTPGH